MACASFSLRAVGAHIFVSGFLVILFDSIHDIQAVYEGDCIIEVGGLRTVYNDYRLEPSANIFISGIEVSEKHKSLV